MRLLSVIGLVPPHGSRNDVGAPRIVEGPTIEAVASLEVLARGWERVRANKGGPGCDGMTLEGFARGLDGRLAYLSDALLDGSYRPGRLRRVTIAKPDGRRRMLAIPSIVDRVAQTALLLVLTPALDPKMSEASWAYRPGRGVRDALSVAESLFEAGFTWSVDADITRYFDRIPHGRLVDELTIWIDDERIIRLCGLWLVSFDRRGVGIAQGAPISPLLANLYLHPVDRQIVAAGFPLVRYADDLVVLAKSKGDAAAALDLLDTLLKARGLRLNTSKTCIRAPDETFRFLGQDIRATRDETPLGDKE